VEIEGEVRAGTGFERPIGGGLEVYLQPIAAGWILRVIPTGGWTGAPGAMDYAQVATPPYNSVTPLSVSTDFSFRAQDAVGWNPREFHFVTDHATYARLSDAVRSLDPTGRKASPTMEQEIARTVARASQGGFRIVDARLIPGTANQSPMAGLVASHFASTAHTLAQPNEGKPDALGRLLWLRFKISLELPSGFHAAPGLQVNSGACLLK
jgi:hypothetical protein